MHFTNFLAIAILSLAGSSAADPSPSNDHRPTRHKLRLPRDNLVSLSNEGPRSVYSRRSVGLETREPARLKIGILDPEKLKKMQEAAKRKGAKAKKTKKANNSKKKSKKEKTTLKRPPGLKTGKGGNEGPSTAYQNGGGGSSTAYQNRRSVGVETREPMPLKIGFLDSKKLKKMQEAAKRKGGKVKKTKKAKKSKKSTKGKMAIKRPPGLKTGKGGNEGTNTAYQNGGGGSSTAYQNRR